MKRYPEEFKEQVIAECEQVGNISVVARRYQISKDTVYYWIQNRRKHGTATAPPKAASKRIQELEKRLRAVSTENEQLKRLLAEKELELAILRELRDRVNPR